MNWENSKSLTPLKHDFLVAFFEREQGFFLTGGSALGIFYLEHRLSYDLDLFSTGEIDWHSVTNALIDTVGDIGAESKTISSSPYHHRFEIIRDNTSELIDFVLEKTPQIDIEKHRVDTIRVDTLREIGVNKLCTLLERSEVKDIVDLYFLEKAGFVPMNHLDEALKKDGGFDPSTVGYLLSQITIKNVPPYLLKPLTIAELSEYVQKLKKEMAERAFPA